MATTNVDDKPGEGVWEDDAEVTTNADDGDTPADDENEELNTFVYDPDEPEYRLVPDGRPPIVVQIPAPDMPGYLRRQRRLLAAAENMATLEGIENLVTELSRYVTEPEDPETLKEYLLDASQDVIMNFLAALGGDKRKVPFLKALRPKSG